MAYNRVWNSEARDYEEVETGERNGNLTFVEYPDGRVDWVAPHELEEK